MGNLIYKAKDLKDILIIMQSYIESANNEDKNAYLQELSMTGIFHDAIGKVVDKTTSDIIVNTEY